MPSGGARPGAGRKKKDGSNSECKHFSAQEIEIMLDSPYVAYVSRTTISFTIAFKEMFWQRYKAFYYTQGRYGKTEKAFFIERNKSYPFCNIHYVTDGEMIVEYRGKKYTVKKGQLFILPLFEAHKYWSAGSNDLY